MRLSESVVREMFQWKRKCFNADEKLTFQDRSWSQKEKRTTERNNEPVVVSVVSLCSKSHGTKLVPLLSFSVPIKGCYRKALKFPMPLFSLSFNAKLIVCDSKLGRRIDEDDS